MNAKRWLFLGVALLWGLMLTACGSGTQADVGVAEGLSAPLRQSAQTDGTTPHTLTVTGTGEVSLTPDLAYLTLAVETRHRDLGKAVAENNQRAAQVIQALRQGGVEEKDIHTANFSVQQDRHYDDQGNLILGPYTVTNSIVVTVRDIEKLGVLLNAALQAGANRMDNLTFGSSQIKDAQLQAKLAAIADAQKQAEAIAQQAGVTLEAVQSITFRYTTPVSGPVYRAEVMSAAPPAEVPVAPGEMKVTATVTMVFIIR